MFLLLKFFYFLEFYLKKKQTKGIFYFKLFKNFLFDNFVHVEIINLFNQIKLFK